MQRLDPAVFTLMREHPEKTPRSVVDHLEQVYQLMLQAAGKAEARREEERARLEREGKRAKPGPKDAEARAAAREARERVVAELQSASKERYDAEMRAGLPKEARTEERAILLEVATKYRQPTEVFTSSVRGEVAMKCRSEGAYRLRVELQLPFPRIAMLFRREHSGIMYMVERHGAKFVTEPT
jgi:hypothetical protein